VRSRVCGCCEIWVSEAVQFFAVYYYQFTDDTKFYGTETAVAIILYRRHIQTVAEDNDLFAQHKYAERVRYFNAYRNAYRMRPPQGLAGLTMRYTNVRFIVVVSNHHHHHSSLALKLISDCLGFSGFFVGQSGLFVKTSLVTLVGCRPFYAVMSA